MIGQVKKAHTDTFFVVDEKGAQFKVLARGTLKKEGKIVVGDYVEFDQDRIVKVLDRKNRFIRPSVSNIDAVVIVVSPTPEPDFYLIDKLLLNALSQDLSIIIAVNKTDISDDLYAKIQTEYAESKVKITKISTVTGQGIEELKQELVGKLTLLAGQSAVGKTSLINALFNLNLKTGEVSQKINRGKHTTTYSEIYHFDKIKIIDSPGFCGIDANIQVEELIYFYPQYFELSSKCKFRGCTHITEPDCAVKQAVEKGELSQERYNRYKIIYNEIKERRDIYGKY